MQRLTDLEFIDFLEANGCVPRAVGDRLRCVVPGGGALDEGLRREIKARKERLLELVRGRRVPLSFEQERLWFLNQLSDPRHSAYHMPAAFRLRGELDTDILSQALTGLFARHDSLRTVIKSEHGEPYQETGPAMAVRLRAEDHEEARLESVLAAEAARPFDLEKGPLARLRLLRLGDSDHVLMFCQHHIIGDGWSTGILFEELSESYAALISGRKLELPPLALQYADYAVWQRTGHWLKRLRPQEEYWRQKLAGLEELEVLPDFTRPAVKTYRGAREGFEIDAATAAKLTGLAGQEGVTPFMVLLTALTSLLLRFCSADDVAVGTPVASRGGGDLEGTVGFFVNTLVMRIALDGNPSFSEALRRVSQTCLEAYAHPELPFGRLVDVLEAERDPARSPLFGVLFVLRHESAESGLRLPGCEVEELKVTYPTAKFDLAFELSDSGGRLTGEVEYNTDLYRPETIGRLIACYKKILKAGCGEPGRGLVDIDILSPGERERLLRDYNRTEAPFSQATLPALFKEQASETPEAAALIYGDTSISYRRLDRESDLAAASLLKALRAGGALPPPDTIVGLPAASGPEAVVCLLGILKAGCAYLPLDLDYPPERLAFMLKDSQAEAVLASSDMVAGERGERLKEALRLLASRVEGVVPPLVPVDAALDGEKGAEAMEAVEAVPSGPRSLAYVIYTSGSTGDPKGVLLEHRGVVNLVSAQREVFEVDRLSRVLQFAPLSFDASVSEIFTALLSGAELHLLPEEAKKDADGLLDLIHRNGITTATLPPALLSVMTHRRLPSLQTLVVAGDVCDGNTLRRWSDGRRLINAYGPTEATVCASMGVWREGASAVNIGAPMKNVRAYVLDERMRLSPPGAPGELYLSGSGLARGYLNHPSFNKERFVRNPFTVSSENAGDDYSRLYRTGDLARWLPGGELEFLGRRDHQVKVRGYRVEPGEIEAALMPHPAVARCVVAPTRGEGPARLVAFWVAAAGRSGTPSSELREFLDVKLPAYLVPSAFVRLDALPLTPSGKIDRKALPLSETRLFSAEGEGRPPETATEKKLAGIWERVLKLKRVGTDQNFFSLGGDSIMSIQVVSRAREAGLALDPKDMFRYPTISALAARVDRTTRKRARRRPARGPALLTPIQRWFFELELPEVNHFNQAVLFKPEEELPAGLVREAASRLAKRHDSLRLRFSDDAGEWRQYYAEGSRALEIPVCEVDLSGRGGELGAECLKLQSTLDIRGGPVAVVGLFKGLPGSRQAVLVAVHHLVVDAVSWQVLLGDFTAICKGLASGKPARFGSSRGSSYQQWGEAFERYLTDRAEGQWDYWLEMTAGATPVRWEAGDEGPELPGLHRPKVELSEEETASLMAAAPRAYRASARDLLVAALLLAWSGVMGRGDLLLDLEGHGRQDIDEAVDVTRTTGWFTSLYPVLLKLPPLKAQREGDAFFSSLIKTVKEDLRAVPDGGIGYGALRYLSGDPRAGRLKEAIPAEVAFNYLGRLDSGPWGQPEGTVSPDNPAPHPLEINAAIDGGRLRVEFAASPRHLGGETAGRLAREFRAALLELLEHCLKPGSQGRTPSDFPLARLSQAQVDALAAAGGVDSIYRLTPMQEGLLFHSLYAPESDQYLEQLCWTFRGGLDTAALKRAWEQIVDRHGVFRTAFFFEGLEHPVQVVRRETVMDWREEDWRGGFEERRAGELAGYLERDRLEGFDLRCAGLTRFHLIRTGEEEYRFIWCFHHILIDGWCSSLLLDELKLRYAALTRGERFRLPSPPPFEEYVGWLDSRQASGDEEFWRAQLAGLDEPTPLGVNRRALEILKPISEVAERAVHLSEAETEEVAGFAREHRVTLNAILQTAWAVVMGEYGGQPEVVLGVNVSGRPGEIAGVEKMVGLFVNAVPVRFFLERDSSALEAVSSMHQLMQEINEHSYGSLADIQRFSRVPAGTPLFFSEYVFENYPVDETVLTWPGGVAISDFKAVEKTNYPLGLMAAPGGRLQFKAAFDSESFTPGSIERMLKHLQAVVKWLVRNPAARLGEAEIMPPEDRELVLRRWSGASVGIPAEGPSVVELFKTRVSNNPDSLALCCAGQRLTYGELDRLSDGIADGISAALDGAAGRMVGLCLTRGATAVAAVLGIGKSGAAFVPMDPDHPNERLSFVARDAGLDVILTERKYLSRLRDVLAGQRPVELLCLNDPGNGPTARGPRRPPDPRGIAYVIYTSGSTGTPKGVTITNRNLADHIAAAVDHYGITADDVVLQFSTLTFDASLEQLYQALVTGATLVMRGEPLWTPAELRESIIKEGVTVMNLPTGYFREVARDWSEDPGGIPDSRLRLVIAGGDVLDAASAGIWRELPLPPHRFLNAYGPTETTVTAATYEIPERVGSIVPIGKPLGARRLYVLRDGRVTPPGVPGELCIGGIGVSPGYLGRPEATHESFSENPFAPAEEKERGYGRLYRTGDIARWNDQGDLEFMGRLDFQAKLRGFRVEPQEIEAVLSLHPAVAGCCVVVSEGGDERELIAYYVPGPPAEGSAERFAEAAREAVSAWEAVYDELFESVTSGPAADAFDTTGWNSSYDGSPIPATEMREWVDFTVSRILDLHPKSALEIGCGTGLILTRVAPHCGRYLGVDFSEPAVSRLREYLQKNPIPGAEVLRERADGIGSITGAGDQRFPVDTVVINSVVQYFPGLGYLEEVLELALDAMAGGSIFVGDVRDLRLREAFRLSVEMEKAGGITDGPALSAQLARDALTEKELLVSPAYFLDFAARHGWVTDVRVMPKEGVYTNEMNDYRYDVVLKIDGEGGEGGDALPAGGQALPTGGLEEVAWEPGMGLDGLLEFRDSALCVRGYPNRRVWAPQALSLMLDGRRDLTDAEAQLKREADGFLSIEQLASLGDRHGYRLFPRLHLTGERAPALLDLYFMQEGIPPATAGSIAPGEVDLATRPVNRFYRDSIDPEELREFVSRQLPGYMVPAFFVELDALPLTTTGKPDRRALSRIGRDVAGPADGLVAPRSEQERLLANIFSDVLRLEKVGITDDFFQLGGHSLSATRVASRINRVFGVQCPVKSIFEHPRILDLAPFVQGLLEGGAAPKPPLVPAGGGGRLPLSFAQERMWFLDRFESVGESSYHMPAAFMLDGPLDVSALARSFDTLTSRHQSLRTVFKDEGGEPYQVVLPPAAAALLAEEAEGGEPREAIDRLLRLPFDLRSGPLFRAHLLKTGDDRHVLLINQHHITGDAWSAGILFKELSRCYEAFSRGRNAELAPLRLSYSDFAIWQKSWLKGDVLRGQLDYWRQTLEGASPLELPAAHPRRERAARRGKQFTFRLDEAATARLRKLSRQAGASLYMAVLAAYSALLGRYAGTEDVVVGTVTAGRTEEELEKLAGFFVNTLLVRVDLSADPSYRELLERVRKITLEAYAHQDLPFEKLVAELRPERGGERGGEGGTLLQTMLIYQNVPEAHLDLAGLEVRSIGLELGSVRSDLDLYAWEAGGALEFCLVYDEDLFDEEVVARMAGRLAKLMATVSKDAEAPLLSISFHEEPEAPRPPVPSCSEPAEREPLSYHQERLWFIDNFEEGNVYETKPTYHNVPLIIRFSEPVDPRKLEAGLRHVVRAHGALRTRIVTGADEAWQSVETGFVPRLETINMPGSDPDFLIKKALEFSGQPFAGGEEPRLRAALLSDGGGESVFVLAVHHILVDRRSMGIIAEELARCYGTLVEGNEFHPSVETPEALTYAGFSEWQRGVPESRWEPLFFEWKWRLRGELPVLTLPEDRPRPAIHTYSAGVFEFAIPPGLAGRLEGLAGSEGLEMSTILLSGLAVTLLCYSGQKELLIGITGDGRPEGAAGSVGPFDELLPIRIRPGGHDSFRVLLGEVAGLVAEARASATLPFDLLVEKVNPPIDMSRTALFDVMFEFGHGPEQPLRFGNVPAEVHESNLGFGKYDLSVLLVEDHGSIKGTAAFNADIYDRSTVEAMMGRLATVLDNLVRGPGIPLKAVSFLTSEEERLLTGGLNGTAVSFPEHETLHGLFARQAGMTPENIAVVYKDERVSYRELDERANRLAHHLKGLGVGPDALVALCLERSVEAVVCMLAVLKAGGAYLPIDASLPRERVGFIIEDSGAGLLLTAESLRADHGIIEAMPATAPDGGAAPENLAYCIYTSGSTGRPKGVLVEHRNVVRLLINDRLPFEFSERDNWTMFHSYAFDFSVWEMYGALLYGGRLVIVPTEATRDASLLLDLIVKERVTVLNQVPPAFYALSREALERRVAELPLRCVIFGGEALDFAMLREWRKAYPAVRLVNMYGITETCVHVTFKEVLKADIVAGNGNIGRPLPDTTVYVMDGDLRLLPAGVPGEMCVGGGGLARGYLGRDDLTASRFVPDPFKPGERLYRSGDIGRYLPSGELEYLGRLDDQVQIRGFRVEPGEIASRLAEHPDITGAAVRTWERHREAASPAGPDTIIASYYVLSREVAAGREPGAEDLKSFLAERLPAYMLPSFVLRMDALPLTAGGKIDRKALPDPRSVLTVSAAATAPRDPVELRLKETWEELIGARVDSIESDFFLSGGHSLLAVKLVARINKSFGTSHAVSWAFLNQTIEKQARSLREEGKCSPFRPLVAFNRDGGRPPLFFVHPGQAGAETYGRLAALLDPGLPFYALESRNLYDEKKPMLRTVESLAEAYLADILPVCGKGPCSLGGWSFGGLVAFEMARLLRKLGIEVEELFLLDAILLKSRAGELLGELAEELPGELRGELFAGNPLAEELPGKYRDRLVEVMRLEFKAMAEYEAGPYPGRATLIVPAEERPAPLPESGAARLAMADAGGWSAYIRDLEVRQVPGDHLGMMEGRGLKEIARIISGWREAGKDG